MCVSFMKNDDDEIIGEIVIVDTTGSDIFCG